MKFTAAFVLATAALISATPIDGDVDAVDAQGGLKHLRIMFNHDFDCKWRHKGKGETHQNPKDWKKPDAPNKADMPSCDSKDFKGASFMFDKKDEHGKCFSPKDLKFPKDQHNFHSFSYCLPQRLQEKGCKFFIHGDVHCEGEPLHVIDTKKNKDTKQGLQMGHCMNVADGIDQPEHINVGGGRSIRVECPAKQNTCDPADLEKHNEWYIPVVDDIAGEVINDDA